MLRKATLGIVIENGGAKAATSELDKLGATGEAAGRRIQTAFSATDRQMRSMMDSMRKMKETAAGNAMASMISASDPFQKQAAAMKEASAAAENHHLALGRINLALESLASEALGANSRIGSLSTRFLEFGVGGVVTGAVLAGLAGIALAWDKITESTRKAKEAQEKLTAALDDWFKAQNRGPAGERREQSAAESSVIIEAAKRAQGYQDILNSPAFMKRSGIDPDAIRQALADEEKIMKEGRAKIDAAGADINATVYKSNQERAALYVQDVSALIAANAATADERKNALSLAKGFEESLFAVVRTRPQDLGTQSWLLTQIKAIEAAFDSAKRAAQDLDSVTSETIMRKFGVDKNPPPISTVASKGLALGGAADAIAGMRIAQNVFNSLEIVAKRAKETVDQSKRTATLTAAEMERMALKSIAIGNGLNLLSQLGASGGMLSGIIQGGMSGMAGGPWGVAIGAVSALASGILSLGHSAKESAAQIAAAKQAVDDYFLGVDAANGSPTAQLQQAINQAKAEAQKAIDQLNAAYPEQIGYVNGHQHNFGRGPDYQQKLDEINKKEQERVTYLQQQAEQLERASKIQGLKDSIASIGSLIDNLTNFRKSIALSSLSTLSPVQQLAEAKRQYDEVLGKARAGDQAAAGQLPQVAQQYLQLARADYASGSAYQQIYNQVLRDNDEITSLFKGQLDSQQKMLDALQAIQDRLANTNGHLQHIDGSIGTLVDQSKGLNNGTAMIGTETITTLDSINESIDNLATALREGGSRATWASL